MVVNPTVLRPGGVAEIRDIAERSVTQQTPSPKAKPAQISQFNQAMQSPPAASSPTLPSSQPPPTTNLGDRILQNLQRASKPVEGQAAMRAVAQSSRESLSARSAAEAQYKLSVWGIDAELESKVAGKTTQSVQTLIKMQ